MRFGNLLPVLGGVFFLPAACGGSSSGSEGVPVLIQPASLAAESLGGGPELAVQVGRRLFDQPFRHTNGRACATCHVERNHTTLLPADVEARLATNPSDPLFNPIDADDPTAATPTYEHLKKGLIRITLTLPDNMDLINADGSQVVTPPDRKFSVWRGVPTVENTFYTAPYQYDGRFPTYQIQAQGAITAHSQGPQVGEGELSLLAAFESTVFSSDRAESVADQLRRGVRRDKLKNPEDGDTSNGNIVYVKACKGCHGGATDNDISNPAVLNRGFNLFSAQPGGAGPVVLNHAGNVVFEKVPDPTDSTKTIIVSISNPQPHDNFVNVGFAGVSSLEQEGFFLPIGPDPSNPHLLFNESVTLPHYRFRFYTDGSRTTQVADLPPIPASTGFPCNGPLCGPLNPPFDANGLPIVGPNFFMQAFSTDPGRAGITGNPADFEAFDIPQLRGIANTAPYFHDNSHATLADVVDTYSRFILPPITALNLPAVNPPECPTNPPTCGLPPEALSPKDKADLLAFLQTF